MKNLNVYKLLTALVLLLSTTAQADQYTCFEGKDIKSSKFTFKLKELPEMRSFIFEYYLDQKLTLSNRANQSGSERQVSSDGRNTKIFAHNPSNLTLKIYSQQQPNGTVAGEFNFYQPSINGSMFTRLNCVVR